MENLDIWKKRNSERQLITEMIKIYCHAQKHGAAKDGLCDECDDLLAYAVQRIDHCPHMASKVPCSDCPTQCYSQQRRQQIRQVMRCAGPRIMLVNPKLAIKHAMSSRGKGGS